MVSTPNPSLDNPQAFFLFHFKPSLTVSIGSLVNLLFFLTTSKCGYPDLPQYSSSIQALSAREASSSLAGTDIRKVWTSSFRFWHFWKRFVIDNIKVDEKYTPGTEMNVWKVYYHQKVWKWKLSNFFAISNNFHGQYPCLLWCLARALRVCRSPVLYSCSKVECYCTWYRACSVTHFLTLSHTISY